MCMHTEYYSDWFFFHTYLCAYTRPAQAVAIKEGTIKTAHRVSLDFTVHAPLIYLPFSTKLSAGGIIIDLGDFRLSNK